MPFKKSRRVILRCMPSSRSRDRRPFLLAKLDISKYLSLVPERPDRPRQWPGECKRTPRLRSLRWRFVQTAYDQSRKDARLAPIEDRTENRIRRRIHVPNDSL